MKGMQNEQEGRLALRSMLLLAAGRCVYCIRWRRTVRTLSFFRCVYFWPVPTNMIGWPVLYTIDTAAPTEVKSKDNVSLYYVSRHINDQILRTFVINRVKLGEHDAVDAARITAI
jgi:hypothetical protein